MKTYRPGPVGALMDEYERATNELKRVISTMPQQQYVAIVDKETKDPDCQSVQTIINHVVRAGYGYANSIRKQFSESFAERQQNYDVRTPEVACIELDNMLGFTLLTLENKWNITDDEVMANIIKTPWGQNYDFEQLMEHAIVHVLRHRRQVERLVG